MESSVSTPSLEPAEEINFQTNDTCGSGRRREKEAPHEAKSLLRVWARVSQDWEHLGLLGNSATSVYLCCSWKSGKKTGISINNILPVFHPSLQTHSPPLCSFWQDYFSGGLGQLVYLGTCTVHTTEALLTLLLQTWMRPSPSIYSSYSWATKADVTVLHWGPLWYCGHASISFS